MTKSTIIDPRSEKIRQAIVKNKLSASVYLTFPIVIILGLMITSTTLSDYAVYVGQIAILLFLNFLINGEK